MDADLSTPSITAEYSTGDVGIGVAAPAAKLHIRPGTDDNLEISGPSSGDGIQIHAINNARSGSQTLELNAGTLKFLVHSSLKGTIDTNGRLALTSTGSSAGVVLGATNTVTLVDDATVAERAGTARRNYKVTLAPEFPSAVLTGDGSNNTGTMTSDFCSNGATNIPNTNTSVCSTSGDIHTYYAWTANATNDYDIWMEWQVPSDFSDWAASTPVQFYNWRDSTSDSITLTLYTAAGATCGTATTSDGTVDTWQLKTYTISGCSPAAGDIMKMRVQLSVGVSSEYARVGEIIINYLSKFK